MTDAQKVDGLARVLWLAHWDGQPPYEWDDEPGRATDWRNTAIAALTWLDSLEDGPAVLRAERDALRAEIKRLRRVGYEWQVSRALGSEEQETQAADALSDALSAIPVSQYE